MPERSTPLATGVLVVAVGHVMRFLQYLPLEPKEYVGKIQFGKETTTQDAEGEVIAEKTVPDDFCLQRLLDILPTFAGEIEQIPPMYSAVKKDGKPLYSYAREGQWSSESHGKSLSMKLSWRDRQRRSRTRRLFWRKSDTRTLAQNLPGPIGGSEPICQSSNERRWAILSRIKLSKSTRFRPSVSFRWQRPCARCPWSK